MKSFYHIEKELAKELHKEEKTFKKSVKHFAKALHPRNYYQMRSFQITTGLVLAVLITPVTLGPAQYSGSQTEQPAETKSQLTEAAPTKTLTQAIAEAQTSTNPNPNAFVQDDQTSAANNKQNTAQNNVESTKETSSTQQESGGDGLIVQYKANNVVRNYYVHQAAWIIDTNTGKRIKRVEPGTRLRISHIAVRGKKASNGRIFGYFYWVQARQGVGKIDRGIRIDHAFAITPGMRIRNHLPLYNIYTTGGRCTTRRPWHQHMDNRMVKAFQELHFKYGKSAVTFKSAWRSNGEQECLRQNPSGYPVAQGVSQHQLGKAIDLPLDQANHYAGFLRGQGLCRPVSGDPIHFEPCGNR